MIRSKVPTKAYRDNFDSIEWNLPETLKMGKQDTLERGKAPLVIHDIQPFVSPVDGSVVTSRRKLREHNARNGVISAGDLTPEFSAKQARALAREKDAREKRNRIDIMRDSWEHQRDKSRYSRY